MLLYVSIVFCEHICHLGLKNIEHSLKNLLMAILFINMEMKIYEPLFHRVFVRFFAFDFMPSLYCSILKKENEE